MIKSPAHEVRVRQPDWSARAESVRQFDCSVIETSSEPPTDVDLFAKAQRIEQLLTDAYGERVWRRDDYDTDLTGALVATILSQNTSDLNSGRAFLSLKAAFPGGWDAVRRAPVKDVADAIRSGGLADIKAPRIQRVLQLVFETHGRTDLQHLAEWTDEDIRVYLRGLPGVGAKTAACVLMFNLGRPALPVDTHVHRVAGRLGLIGPKVNADKAHELLRALVHDDQTYSFHVHLIEHGRRTCHAQRPACQDCPVIVECDYYRAGKNTAGGKIPKVKERRAL